MRFAKWGIFLIVASFLGWQIVVVNLAEYFVLHGNEAGDEKALRWYPEHPGALLRQGVRLLESDPAQAEQLLREAIVADPASAHSFVQLALLWDSRGEREQAAKLAAIAARLAPMRSHVQLGVAELWARQEQLSLAIKHLSRALELQPGLQEKVFPRLLRFAHNPASHSTFASLLNSDGPSWWPVFFNWLAAKAANLETVSTLYKLRNEGGEPTVEEQHDYMVRLQKEGLWQQAYFIWLNNLDADQSAELGNIYNGSFELGVSDEGFDWRTPMIGGVFIETLPVYGATGERALHVVFQGRRVQFKHLHQYLFLQPGSYRLHGRVWPDGLQTEQGPRWALYCLPDARASIATSERFLGKEQWRRFAIHFQVPSEDCSVQQLRLELVGRFGEELEASGAIWFDGLSIRKVDDEVETAAPESHP